MRGMKIFEMTAAAKDSMVDDYMAGVGMNEIAESLRKNFRCFQKTTSGKKSTITQVYNFVKNNYMKAIEEAGFNHKERAGRGGTKEGKSREFKGNLVANDGIHSADYSNKIVKRNLEETTALTVDSKGGWFGIPGPAAKEHVLTFSTITNESSPIVLAERDMHQVMRMYNSLEQLSEADKKNITFEHGDLFDVLKNFNVKRKSANIDRFAYGHLDFCVGGKTLIEEGILDNLVWLSKWGKLQDVFYLDLSMCIRNDMTGSCKTLSEQIVPNIFSMFGWTVSSPNIIEVDKQGKGNRFMYHYNDARQAHMVNALYRMERQVA